MTSNEIIKILREYIAKQEQGWEFYNIEDLEMAVFSSSECQYSNVPEETIEVLQAVCVTLENVLISRASAQFGSGLVFINLK